MELRTVACSHGILCFTCSASQETKYKSATKSLGAVVETCTRQNNTVDIYEEYFAGEEVDMSSEPPSAKGLGARAALFAGVEAYCSWLL